MSVFQEVPKDDFSREIKGFRPIKTNDVLLMHSNAANSSVTPTSMPPSVDIRTESTRSLLLQQPQGMMPNHL